VRSSGSWVPDIEKLLVPKIHNLPNHTVTVTEVADVDLAGGTGFMLGKNDVGACIVFLSVCYL